MVFAWSAIGFPLEIEIAADEYGHELAYFERMLAAGAVDLLQADATRCYGLSGFIAVGALCEARAIDLAATAAPALHRHACCAVSRLRYQDGSASTSGSKRSCSTAPRGRSIGAISPDPARPGLGLELKRADARHFAV